MSTVSRTAALVTLLLAVALAGAACSPTSGPLGTPASPATSPASSDEPLPSDVAPEIAIYAALPRRPHPSRRHPVERCAQRGPPGHRSHRRRRAISGGGVPHRPADADPDRVSRRDDDRRPRLLRPRQLHGQPGPRPGAARPSRRRRRSPGGDDGSARGPEGRRARGVSRHVHRHSGTAPAPGDDSIADKVATVNLSKGWKAAASELPVAAPPRRRSSTPSPSSRP